MADMKTENKSESMTTSREKARCPFCESDNTELLSLFGQNLLSSTWYCRSCKTAFEAVRWDADDHELNHGSE